MHIFVDSDVIISSLLSSKGASYELLHTEAVSTYISSFSQSEITIVCNRLQIPQENLETLIQTQLRTVELHQSHEEIKHDYQQYVSDINDAHIVAGAHKILTRFLITYNLKHFKSDKIKKDFNIITLSPGMFLQYLRSLE